MIHTFTHFGPRINLVRTLGREEIMDTFSISDAVALRSQLELCIDNARAVEAQEAEDSRERYSIELGVNHNGARVCALEAGPFNTSEEAVKFAFAVRSRQTIDVADLPITDWHDLGPRDADNDLPIVGATLNIFTNRGGTVRDVDLY